MHAESPRQLKMAIPTLLASISKTLLDNLPNVIQTVASRHDIQDPQTFSQDLLAGLGLSTSLPPAPKPKPKRVVSGAMKAKYLALPGATEDGLLKTIKAYKEATEVTDWITFATSYLKPEAAPAAAAEEEDELQTFLHEDETLLLNQTTGMIYVDTLEAGRVPIGRAGKGRFAHIKLPE